MIGVSIKSRNEQVVLTHAETLDAKVLQALKTGLARGLLLVVGMVQLDFLSGPRPSKIQSVTGRLRQSITSKVEGGNGRIVGRVGSNVKYAAYHEFGFHGTVNVRAHTRVMQNFNESGSEVPFAPGRVVSGVLQTRKQVARRQKRGFVAVQFVRAHSRRVNYAGKPYVRPALEKSGPVIIAELNKELDTIK